MTLIFKEFLQLKNQLFVATKVLGGSQNLYSIRIAMMSKEVEKKLKLVHKVLDLGYHMNRTFCVTLLQNFVDKPGYFKKKSKFYRKSKGVKFLTNVYADHKLE